MIEVNMIPFLDFQIATKFFLPNFVSDKQAKYCSLIHSAIFWKKTPSRLPLMTMKIGIHRLLLHCKYAECKPFVPPALCFRSSLGELNT